MDTPRRFAQQAPTPRQGQPAAGGQAGQGAISPQGQALLQQYGGNGLFATGPSGQAQGAAQQAASNAPPTALSRVLPGSAEPVVVMALRSDLRRKTQELSTEQSKLLQGRSAFQAAVAQTRTAATNFRQAYENHAVQFKNAGLELKRRNDEIAALEQEKAKAQEAERQKAQPAASAAPAAKTPSTTPNPNAPLVGAPRPTTTTKEVGDEVKREMNKTSAADRVRLAGDFTPDSALDKAQAAMRKGAAQPSDTPQPPTAPAASPAARPSSQVDGDLKTKKAELAQWQQQTNSGLAAMDRQTKQYYASYEEAAKGAETARQSLVQAGQAFGAAVQAHTQLAQQLGQYAEEDTGE